MSSSDVFSEVLTCSRLAAIFMLNCHSLVLSAELYPRGILNFLRERKADYRNHLVFRNLFSFLSCQDVPVGKTAIFCLDRHPHSAVNPLLPSLHELAER